MRLHGTKGNWRNLYNGRYVNGERMGEIMDISYPKCLKCESGVMVPLSDYGREGSSIMYKAWVCTNPDCGYNLRIDNGEISVGKSIIPSGK